jgi:hypothetical protein
MPLKFENVAQVGDFIKAYDFQPWGGPETECYLVGKVLAKNDGLQFEYSHYLIEVIDGQFRGEALANDELGRKVRVPFETMMTEWDGRVTKL